VHSRRTVAAALRPAAAGANGTEIARRPGVPRRSVGDCLRGSVPHTRAHVWQVALVTRRPEELLRGLIHADGCRFQNSGRNWSWRRHRFTQCSDDIRRIFCDTCDLIGMRWTASNTRFTSPARRTSRGSMSSSAQRREVIASPAPPRHARPPPDCGRRASASPRRGGCGQFRVRDRGRSRGRRRWRARGRRAGLRARVA